MDIWVLVIIGITIIIGALIFYETKKANYQKDKSEREFWDRESQANSTRRKDISYLNYIEIPLDKLPLSSCEDEEITVDMRLTANGKEKLAMGYESNSKDKFTVYWSDQKIYTFTVSGAPIDDTFSIIDVFDEETASAFCSTMDEVVG